MAMRIVERIIAAARHAGVGHEIEQALRLLEAHQSRQQIRADLWTGFGGLPRGESAPVTIERSGGRSPGARKSSVDGEIPSPDVWLNTDRRTFPCRVVRLRRH
ncbi:MAG: hypothetical protein ACR2OO_03500 [Thermomicrobiales bacterium]